MEKHREEKVSIVWRASTRIELVMGRLESFYKIWSCCVLSIKERSLHSQGIIYLFYIFLVERNPRCIQFHLNFLLLLYIEQTKTRVRIYLFLVEQWDKSSIFLNQNCKPLKQVAHLYRRLELEYRSILKCEIKWGHGVEGLYVCLKLLYSALNWKWSIKSTACKVDASLKKSWTLF